MTTQRPRGRKEEHVGSARPSAAEGCQRALGRRNRVRSALTPEVNVIEAENPHHFKHLAKYTRGQLRFLVLMVKSTSRPHKYCASSY